MFTRRPQRHTSFAAALTIAMFACAAGAQAADPNGQWIGGTQIEGQRDSDKTKLSLGTVGEENTSLEVELGRTCKLRDGSYTAQGADAWSLRFKPTSGSGACDRLSQGEFVLRDAGPRKLAFEARYPDGKGGQNQRSGTLTRYP